MLYYILSIFLAGILESTIPAARAISFPKPPFFDSIIPFTTPSFHPNTNFNENVNPPGKEPFPTKTIFPETNFCDSETVTDSGMIYTFKQAFSASRAYSEELCNSGVPRASIVCLFDDASKRYKYSLNSLVVIDCDMATVFDILIVFDFNNFTKTHLQNTLVSLDMVTAAANNTASSLTEVIEFINSIARNVKDIQINDTNYETVVSIVNNIAASAQNNFAEQSMYERISSLAQSLVTIGNSLVLPSQPNSVFTILTPNIVAEVSDRSMNENVLFQPLVFSNSSMKEQMQPVSVIIPAEALQRAVSFEKNKKSKGTVRVVNFLYRTGALFSTIEPVDWNSSSKSLQSSNGAAALRQIVSLNLEGQNVSGFGQAISITNHFALMTDPMSRSSDSFNNKIVNQTCVFWDFNIREWSTDGCGLVRDSNPPECKCTHLTNFALLLSIYEIPKNVSLDIVSFIGCVLSSIFQFITITLLCLTPSVRKRHPVIVLVNVSVNLIIVYIVFLAGIGKRDNIPRCIASTVMLHFFLLCSLFWTTVYAHLLYKSFVKVFSLPHENYLARAHVFSYGIPAVIVAVNTAITLSLSFNEKTPSPIFEEEIVEPLAVSALIAENLCWLHGFSLYFAFLLPVGITLVLKVVVFIMVIRKLTWKREQVTSSINEKQNVHQHFFTTVTLASTLGLVWLLGYFMILCRDETCLIAMSWLFTVATTIQGLSIFLLNCVKNEDVRKMWWPCVRAMFASKSKKKVQASTKKSSSDSNNDDFLKKSSSTETKDQTLTSASNNNH